VRRQAYNRIRAEYHAPLNNGFQQVSIDGSRPEFAFNPGLIVAPFQCSIVGEMMDKTYHNLVLMSCPQFFIKLHFISSPNGRTSAGVGHSLDYQSDEVVSQAEILVFPASLFFRDILPSTHRLLPTASRLSFPNHFPFQPKSAISMADYEKILCPYNRLQGESVGFLRCVR
jgi:hypothetical protein